MTSALIVLNFLLLVLGFVVGYSWRDIQDRLKTIEKNQKPDTGATVGSYGKVNEFMVNQSGTTGLVRPKTPQQLEWEEAEQLRQAQHEVK